MKFLLPLILLAGTAMGQDASLAQKFAEAQQVLNQTTATILAKPAKGQAFALAAHESGQIKATILSTTAKTEAQELLLETSLIVEDLAFSILRGTKAPSVAAKAESCDLIIQGIDKRRFASFYEGFEDVQAGFILYFDQFITIADILECQL